MVFQCFFYIQRIYQNAPKKLPKFSQSLPKWAQDGHLGASMAHLGRNLLPTWLQLGLCCAQLRPNVSKSVPERRPKTRQDPPRRVQTSIFFDFRPPSDLDFHGSFINLALTFCFSISLSFDYFHLRGASTHQPPPKQCPILYTTLSKECLNLSMALSKLRIHIFDLHCQDSAPTHQPHYKRHCLTPSTTSSKQCLNPAAT